MEHTFFKQLFMRFLYAVLFFYKKKGGIKMEDWVGFIGNVGFPIVLSIYLLNRIESRLDHMIAELSQISSQLSIKGE